VSCFLVKPGCRSHTREVQSSAYEVHVSLYPVSRMSITKQLVTVTICDPNTFQGQCCGAGNAIYVVSPTLYSAGTR
jgi:hypothetical protein